MVGKLIIKAFQKTEAHVIKTRAFKKNYREN